MAPSVASPKTEPAIRDLQKRLSAAARKDKRDWFNNYLRGAIEYRGVPTPQIAKILKSWAADNKIADFPASEQLLLVQKLLGEKFAEDKFAAVLFLQTLLRQSMPADKVLAMLEKAFAKNHIHDWSTNDWLCVRVLDPLVQQDAAVAKRIARWRRAKNLWQRRSAIVAFRGAARLGEQHKTIAAIINDLSRSSERFIQTGIGWCLADLSRNNQTEARRLFKKHFAVLSVEVIDRHAKYLPEHQKWRSEKRAQVAKAGKPGKKPKTSKKAKLKPRRSVRSAKPRKVTKTKPKR